MARDIKAIQCPKCGSTHKHQVKEDFFQCEYCGTEYYLDSDDKHIYHHHERFSPPQGNTSPTTSKLPVYILAGAIAFIAAVYLIILQPKNKTSNTYVAYKQPRSYYSSFVYTNTANGSPVYLRMGTDYIDKGNNKSEQELHVQFNNVTDGKLLEDRVLTGEVLLKDRCSLTFKTYSADLIYAIGCNTVLLQLDTRNNRLTDVTQSTFKDFPKLSSGVAKLEFHYSKPMITVMNNEGESYYYFPAIKKLLSTEEEADQLSKELIKKRYFEFDYIGDRIGINNPMTLFEVKSDLNGAGDKARREITPGRKFFNPSILYQDESALIISVNTTAGPEPPISIQRIDIANGKVLWALPPDHYYLSSVARCRQGFAIEYRKDEEADYVHGVMVASDKGKIVYNYQLSRTE